VKTGRMRTIRDFRLGAGVTCAGLALSGIFFLFPQNGIAQYTVYEIVAVGAVLSILWGARYYRPVPVRPWLVFAAGIALFIVGDVLTDVYPDWASPAPADYAYLAGYPLLAAAVVLLVISSGSHRRVGALADAAIVTVAFAIFQWVLVMSPALHSSGPVGQRVVLGVLYPTMDIVLLGAAAGFFSSPAWRTPAFALFVSGFALQLVGDEIEGLRGPFYSLGVWINWPFMASYICMGAAALHPSMRELSRPHRETEARVSPWRVATLTLALLTPPVARVIADARDKPEGIYVVASLSAVLAVLVIARMADMLWSIERTGRRLRAQNVELLAADKLKDEFIALVSHDLRTPLTSIIGYVELVLEDEGGTRLDEETRRYLQVVARSSDRLLRLVDDLLLAARLQSGRLMLNIEPADVTALAGQALDELNARAEQKGVSLSLAGGDPVMIECDRRRLLQLLDNLLSNAVKFTREGGRVEVRVERTLAGAALEVLDTGVGVEPGEEERIFDRFYRSPSAVSDHVQGTGLGLFIARAIAERHGGTLVARRRTQGGSIFRLELPAQVARESAPEPELVA
jgi:signal transduction histidine kinase